MPLITTPFTISSLVTVSFSDESLSELTKVLFLSLLSVTSLKPFEIVLVDEWSLDTEPVLVTKLELDSELERPVVFSGGGGCEDDGTFTHRLRRFSLSFEGDDTDKLNTQAGQTTRLGDL
eukprot:TRINITY_DN6771_c0_g1_i1.p1 TRINITY_DN6771_c0_g1~~TRINITY_DN6771_c0_g1_i1.p1  ORF type:complete len:120 (+),score=23.40 TRINITY_DN6771_c0_g1_i1:671-1030(+)